MAQSTASLSHAVLLKSFENKPSNAVFISTTFMPSFLSIGKINYSLVLSCMCPFFVFPPVLRFSSFMGMMKVLIISFTSSLPSKSGNGHQQYLFYLVQHFYKERLRSSSQFIAHRSYKAHYAASFALIPLLAIKNKAAAGLNSIDTSLSVSFSFLAFLDNFTRTLTDYSTSERIYPNVTLVSVYLFKSVFSLFFISRVYQSSSQAFITKFAQLYMYYIMFYWVWIVPHFLFVSPEVFILQK